LAFWILVAIVCAAMILGIASLYALLVQASFQLDDLRSSVASLQQQHEVLREEVAADSSPQRVMQWARARGMQMPDRVVIVHIPASEGAG
jgi:cell division protein FtsL